MLRAAFLKAELDFLESNFRFMDALPQVETPAQFERLCDLGEEVLGQHRRLNPSAKQFSSKLQT